MPYLSRSMSIIARLSCFFAIFVLLSAAPAAWARTAWLGGLGGEIQHKGPPPAIYELEIPAAMPPEIKRQVMAMYAMEADRRGGAVFAFWNKPDKALPAIPWLVALLGDQELAAAKQGRIPVGMVSSRLLEELGRPAVQPLMDALAQGQETHAQVMILRVLGKIGEAGSLEAIIKKSQFPPPPSEREKPSLVNIAPDLKRLKQKPPPPEVRVQAVEALLNFKDPRAASALLASLDDPDPRVRAAAAKTLGQRGDAQALSALIAKGGDAEAEVRREVIGALKRYQDRLAVGVFLAGLKDPDVQVRRLAAEALGAVRDIRASQPLLAAIGDPDPLVRRNAINSLQYYNNPEAVKPLAKALQDKDNGVRAQAALVLGPIGLGPVSDPEAVAALVRATKDVHPQVRRNAVLALKHVRGSQAMEALLAACQDGFKPVRVHAVNNLGFTEDPRAEKSLIQALGDPEADVRQRAAEGLGRLKSREAVKPLIDSLEDPERRVREAAADALQVITGWRYGMDQAGWRHWYQNHRQ